MYERLHDRNIEHFRKRKSLVSQYNGRKQTESDPTVKNL